MMYRNRRHENWDKRGIQMQHKMLHEGYGHFTSMWKQTRKENQPNKKSHRNILTNENKLIKNIWYKLSGNLIKVLPKIWNQAHCYLLKKRLNCSFMNVSSYCF